MKALVPYTPLIFMLVLFYLVIFIPEGRRRKKYKNLLESLKVNDEIITKGGIVGKIVNIQDKFIIVQTGPDKVKLKFDKIGVLNKIEPSGKDV